MIIDFHVHTFPDKIAKKALGKLADIAGIDPYTDGTAGDTVRKMDEAGIDRAVCLNIATRPGQENTINNCAAETNRQYGGRLIAFGSVHPDCEDPLAELDRIVSLGIKGVKLHPDYQGFMSDDKKLFPLYDYLSGTDLIVTFHSGWDCYSPELVHNPPERALKVAKAFPKLKMCLAHFGALRMWEEVYDLLAGTENIVFDTSMAASFGLPEETARKIISRHGEDRILLGSDCPWEDPAASVRYVESLGLPDGTTEKILGGNAARLLKLDL